MSCAAGLQVSGKSGILCATFLGEIPLAGQVWQRRVSPVTPNQLKTSLMALKEVFPAGKVKWMRVLRNFYDFLIQPPSSPRQLHDSVPVQACFIIDVTLFNRPLPLDYCDVVTFSDEPNGSLH